MSKPAVLEFGKHVEKNCLSVQQKIKSKHPLSSSYTQFKVFEPKERIISVVPFDDRVMHHAIMNVLEPVFERQFIFHTYACRKNKGTHRAVKYADECSRNSEWFLKLDVRKFFDSIDHDVLKGRLEQIIKDKDCLNLLYSVIDSYYSTVPGKGLPVGNLTSQFFAHFYLSLVDRYILEQLKAVSYIRYMDDMLLFGKSKKELVNLYTKIEEFCRCRLLLTLKEPVLGLCKGGVSFLGFSVGRDCIRLSRKTVKRKKAKLKRLNHEFENGIIDEEKYTERAKCLLASPWSG
jgi:Retron-type reverse transcriptase